MAVVVGRLRIRLERVKLLPVLLMLRRLFRSGPDDPISVFNHFLVHGQDFAENSVLGTLFEGAGQHDVGRLPRLDHVDRAVGAATHVVAGVQRVLDAHERGLMALVDVALHLGLGHERPAVLHPNRGPHKVEISAVMFEELDEQDAQVDVGLSGVYPRVQLQKVDHEQDEGVGREASGENLRK